MSSHMRPGSGSPSDGAFAIPVLYSDDHLLVLRKPAGLPSVPGRAPGLDDCVASRVQATWPDARVVHRLDMATSGLFVMARGPAAQRALSRAFERREVSKEYVAIVAGTPTASGGDIDLPLRCDWPNRPRQMVDPVEGRPALTRWQHDRSPQRPDAIPDSSRVRLQPITGRTHQLRVHLWWIGHPILGDTLYAPDAVQRLAPRLLLHANRIELPHPAGGRRCVFEDEPEF